MWTQALETVPASDFGDEVRLGLGKPQKELPSKYLYDDVGSALFEVICVLPEYGLTRADERLLLRNAHDIVAQLPEADGVTGIIKFIAGVVDGCEQAGGTAGQSCVGLIHRYLDSNLRI